MKSFYGETLTITMGEGYVCVVYLTAIYKIMFFHDPNLTLTLIYPAIPESDGNTTPCSNWLRACNVLAD